MSSAGIILEHFGLAQVSAPVVEPVSLEEAKLYLKVLHQADDDLIRTLITSAREYCERQTRRSFVTQSLRWVGDCWPSDNVIRLPRPPLQSVASVGYYDAANVLQVLATSDYVVDTTSEPGRVILADGETWPDLASRPEAAQVSYVAGYGDVASVPESIKQAIKLLVEHWYSMRGAVGSGTIFTEMKFGVAALLMSHEVGTYDH